MSSALLYLKISLGLVAIASAIELAFVSATVAYLVQISKQHLVATTSGSSEPVNVPSLPADLSVNQGHTSNGAAGTGLVVIALAGSLALHLRGRPGYYAPTPAGLFSRAWYRLWLALNVPALLLTLGALAYVFAVTRAHAGQRIDVGLLLRGLGAGSKYPLLEWTPQGWFQALLELDLVPDDVDIGAIRSHLKIARGWEYNLIPFFIVQLFETGCALWDARRRRREATRYGPAVGEKGMAYGGRSNH